MERKSLNSNYRIQRYSSIKTPTNLYLHIAFSPEKNKKEWTTIKLVLIGHAWCNFMFTCCIFPREKQKRKGPLLN